MDNLNYIWLLNRYFYTGCLTRYDKFISKIIPSLPFFINSFKVKKTAIQKREAEGKITISVPEYRNNNQGVMKIASFIRNKLSGDIRYAFVHGSYATDDTTPFSDFDGLLIIRDEVFRNRARLQQVAINISHSCSLMIEMDPLQHHGWFILPESALKSWPAGFFPPEILEHAASLTGKGAHIEIHTFVNSDEETHNFDRLASSLEKKLISKSFPGELYSLKNLLSEFMLLPSLFLSATKQLRVYKKFSFEITREVLNGKSYEVMDEISRIRDEWPAKTSRLKISGDCIVSPHLKNLQRKGALPVPEYIRIKLTPALAESMLGLVTEMKKKLNEN